MKPIEKFFVTKWLILLLAVMTICLYSCKTIPPKEPVQISRNLADKGQLTAEQLTAFFWNNNQDIEYNQIYEFAEMYIEEASTENINHDIAWAQMCLETGFLRFGGLVQPEWHNYCGLGALGTENPGCIFETQQLGVRAHIQHLQAYATPEEVTLKNELVDPRYNWVHKTKLAVTVEEMAKFWAADPNYAVKLENLLIIMEESVNK